MALVVVLIKFALLLFSYYGSPDQIISLSDLFATWHRWDSGVYTDIATQGYAPGDMNNKAWSFLSNFPPLYSFLIFVVARVFFLPLATSGVLVSFAAIICASVFLYKLMLLEHKKSEKAWLAVLFLNLYPTSYFTLAVYSESVFLAVTILFFYYLKKEQFWHAALFVSLAVLTRFVGIALLPLFAWFVVRRFGGKAISFLLLLLSSGGLFLYACINKWYFGSYSYFFFEQVSFDATKHLIIPFQETVDILIVLVQNWRTVKLDFMMSSGWNALFTAFALLIIIFGMRKVAWRYIVFSTISLLVFASLSWGISNARYTLSVFPLYMILAQIKYKSVIFGILLCFSLTLGYFTSIFLSGNWAF